MYVACALWAITYRPLARLGRELWVILSTDDRMRSPLLRRGGGEDEIGNRNNGNGLRINSTQGCTHAAGQCGLNYPHTHTRTVYLYRRPLTETDQPTTTNSSTLSRNQRRRRNRQRQRRDERRSRNAWGPNREAPPAYESAISQPGTTPAPGLVSRNSVSDHSNGSMPPLVADPFEDWDAEIEAARAERERSQEGGATAGTDENISDTQLKNEASCVDGQDEEISSLANMNDLD